MAILDHSRHPPMTLRRLVEDIPSRPPCRMGASIDKYSSARRDLNFGPMRNIPDPTGGRRGALRPRCSRDEPIAHVRTQRPQLHRRAVHAPRLRTAAIPLITAHACDWAISMRPPRGVQAIGILARITIRQISSRSIIDPRTSDCPRPGRPEATPNSESKICGHRRQRKGYDEVSRRTRSNNPSHRCGTTQ